MRLDDTAAAYGLFQVVFADVFDHLAVATFRLRERKEPGLAFETVFNQRFSDLLRQLRRELRQFEGRSAVSASLDAVRRACTTIAALGEWRNDRIHARVRLTEDGYALYSSKTRHRLEIARQQIERNINLAVKALVDIEAHMGHLVHLLQWDEDLEQLFSALADGSESPDGDEAVTTVN